MSRIVALGGGRGLAVTLRAARQLADDVTAIVSVADDGGSSGRLRHGLGLPALGDLRKAIVALADPESPLTGLLSYRFAAGDVAGHALGNLLLAAATQTGGDLVAALDTVMGLVGARGRVIPACVDAVELEAVTPWGVVHGQVSVMSSSGIESVRLVPSDPAVPKEALVALERADVVVIGPGSLYTSVLAAVAPQLRDQLRAVRAPLVYVCNLAPERPESSGLDAADHVAALVRHGIRPDIVLFDPACLGGAEDVPGARPVSLAQPGSAVHDPDVLAGHLRDVLEDLPSIGM